MTPQEEDLFVRAGKRIKEQHELLLRLTAPSYHVGVVVAVFPNRYVVDTGNQLFELDRVDTSLDVKVGQPVNIHGDTGQIVRTSEYLAYGATGKIVGIDGDLYQVNTPSGVVSTKNSQVEGLHLGDKVVMNSTNHVIMHKLPEQSQYAFKTQRILDWSDIGAQEDAKKELIDALETPFTQAALYKFFDKPRVKGCLLWGRPGNGKTLLGRAAAGSLARMHGKDSAESGFIYIKGPEILDKYVGETEQRIGEAFDFGIAHFKKHGYPAVLFLDEADAILIRRGLRTASGMEQTIVPMFNARMDGIDDSGVFVILATNRADILDPAIIRPGRIDRKIYVAPPTKENAASIFNIHMRTVPVAKGASKEELITTAVESFYSDKFPLYLIETNSGSSIFNLGNLASGAVIAGIVERASATAISRVIAANVAEKMDFDDIVKLSESVKKCPEGLGLMQQDFETALVAIQKEQQGLSHFDELREFIEIGKLEVKSIEVCHTGQKMEAKQEERRQQQETQVMVVPIPDSKHGAN
jgi:SpoVK/Ycf46/Vps4 family AAA+-type ATPase